MPLDSHPEIFMTKEAARAAMRQLRGLLQTGGDPTAYAAIKQQLRDAVARGGEGAQATVKKLKGQLSGLRAQFDPNAHGAMGSLVQGATHGRNLGATGSQVNVLGAGSEGVAQLVADPLRKQLSVVKTHDPTSSLHNPLLLDNKDKLIGKDIPGVAKLYDKVLSRGRVGGPTGGTADQYIGEYVPGKSMTRATYDPALKQQINAQMQTAAPGIELSDLHSGNFKVSPQGTPKAVDFMAVDQRDMLPVAQRGRPNVVGENINPASDTYSMFGDGRNSLAKRVLSNPVAEAAHDHVMEGNRQQRLLGNRALQQGASRYRGAVLNQAYGGQQPVRPVQIAPFTRAPVAPPRGVAPAAPLPQTALARPPNAAAPRIPSQLPGSATVDEFAPTFRAHP